METIDQHSEQREMEALLDEIWKENGTEVCQFATSETFIDRKSSTEK